MKSNISDAFRGLYAQLPGRIRKLAQRSYQLWREDMRHPGLNFKCVNRSQNIYAIRVGLHWRALGLLDNDTITWFWIGSHAEYDRLLDIS